MNNSNQNIATELIESAFTSVKKDLVKGNMQIPQKNNKQFPTIGKSRISKQQQRQSSNLSTILKKKKSLQQQLERLKYDEKIMKQKRPHPMRQTSSQKKRNFRSTITPDEKQKIKKILNETKKFQENSALKTLELKNKIKNLEEIQKKSKQIQNKLRQDRKNIQAQQKLKQIEIRKQQRTKQIKEKNKEFQRISKIKSLHDKIEQKWKIMQMVAQQENELIYQKNRKQKQFDIQQIQYHSRRYSEIINNQKEKRQQNIQRLKMDLIQRSRIVKHSQSTFFKTICLQQIQKKQSLAEKLRQNHTLHQKKASYAETVREKNKSNFKPANNQKNKPIKTADIRSSRSLDNLELNKLGNSYMKQLQSYIRDVPEDKQTKNNPQQKQSKKTKEQEAVKYPDYLTKARLLRKEKNPQEQPLQIKQLKNILKRKSDSRLKLENAKKIVGIMEQKPGKSSKDLINTIMAKISIIEQFSQFSTLK